MNAEPPVNSINMRYLCIMLPHRWHYGTGWGQVCFLMLLLQGFASVLVLKCCFVMRYTNSGSK